MVRFQHPPAGCCFSGGLAREIDPQAVHHGFERRLARIVLNTLGVKIGHAPLRRCC